MFGKKVKIRPELYTRLVQAAEAAGCASVEEFVDRVLAQECEKLITSANRDQVSEQEVEAISKKLKGLGYLE